MGLGGTGGFQGGGCVGGDISSQVSKLKIEAMDDLLKGLATTHRVWVQEDMGRNLSALSVGVGCV